MTSQHDILIVGAGPAGMAAVIDRAITTSGNNHIGRLNQSLLSQLCRSYLLSGFFYFDSKIRR